MTCMSTMIAIDGHQHDRLNILRMGVSGRADRQARFTQRHNSKECHQPLHGYSYSRNTGFAAITL